MAKPNVWLSVSDLMTGLMIIFLFISIAYLSKVQDNQEVLSNYVETKTKLHDKLVDKFKSDTLKWQMSIGRDLSMKFKNPTVLFEQGKADLTPGFKKVLDEFLPKYFNILVNDSLRNQIEEVRIEGHTDIVPYPQLDPDPYIANAILSQQRALNVLRYFRQMPAYQQFAKEDQARIEFWLTANGLSYGKSLDSEGEYTFESHKRANNAMSRRVEFRIITRGDQVLENFVNKNK